MRFPKQVVFLGYFLIFAGISAGIVASFQEKKNDERSSMTAAGKKMTDSLFKRLFKPYEKFGNIPESFYKKFKADHEAAAISHFIDVAYRMEELKGLDKQDGKLSLQSERDVLKEWTLKLNKLLLIRELVTKEEIENIDAD
jgi:hypothetical protein